VGVWWKVGPYGRHGSNTLARAIDVAGRGAGVSYPGGMRSSSDFKAGVDFPQGQVSQSSFAPLQLHTLAGMRTSHNWCPIGAADCLQDLDRGDAAKACDEARDIVGGVVHVRRHTG